MIFDGLISLWSNRQHHGRKLFSPFKQRDCGEFYGLSFMSQRSNWYLKNRAWELICLSPKVHFSQTVFQLVINACYSTDAGHRSKEFDPELLRISTAWTTAKGEITNLTTCCEWLETWFPLEKFQCSKTFRKKWWMIHFLIVNGGRLAVSLH